MVWSSRGARRSVIPDLADSATLLTLEDLNVPREAASKLVGVVSVCSEVFMISSVVFRCRLYQAVKSIFKWVSSFSR